MQHIGGAGGVLEPQLPFGPLKRAVAQPKLHRARHIAPLAQAFGHAFAKHQQNNRSIPLTGKIARRGGRIAHAFHRALLAHEGDGGVILPARERAEHAPHFAKPALQRGGVGGGEVADGVNAPVVELAPRRRAHIEERLHRQRPDDAAEIFAPDHREPLGFLIIAAELCKHFIERNADGNRDAQFLAHARLYKARKPHGPAGHRRVGGNVKPGFIEAKRLHAIGILRIDRAHFSRKALIKPVVRFEDHKLRAFGERLMDRLRRFDAKALRFLIFSKDNAVAHFNIPAHGDGPAPKLGAVHELDARITAVDIDMQNLPVHEPPPAPKPIIIRFGLHCNRPKQNQKAASAADAARLIKPKLYSSQLVRSSRIHACTSML